MIDARWPRAEARRLALAAAEEEIARTRRFRARTSLGALREIPVPEVTEEELEERMFQIVAQRAVEIAGTEPTMHAALAHVRPGPRFLWVLGYTDADICNGGFHQYFSNPSGDLCALALEGFAQVGSPERAALLRRAMGKFPGGMAPLERQERLRLLAPIDYQAVWRPWIEPIEDAYYRLEERAPLRPLLRAFARRNIGDFFV